jgi:hypothetical protein
VTLIAHTHAWSDWSAVTPSTCTVPGIRTRACVCGAEDTEALPLDADAHAWGEWYTVKEPTVNEEGEKRRVCANNPDHVQTQPIQKLDPPTEEGSSGGAWKSFLRFWQRLINWFRGLFRALVDWIRN